MVSLAFPGFPYDFHAHLDSFGVRPIMAAHHGPWLPLLLSLFPNGPFLEARGATAHLGISRSPQLPPGERAKEVVQLGLEVFQDKPGIR